MCFMYFLIFIIFTFSFLNNLHRLFLVNLAIVCACFFLLYILVFIFNQHTVLYYFSFTIYLFMHIIYYMPGIAYTRSHTQHIHITHIYKSLIYDYRLYHIMTHRLYAISSYMQHSTTIDDTLFEC